MKHLTPEMIDKAENLAASMTRALDAAVDGTSDVERFAVTLGAIIACANAAVAKANAQDPAFGQLIAQAFKNNIDLALSGQFPTTPVNMQ